MNRTKIFALVSVVALFAFVAAFGLGLVNTQVARAQDEMITCDLTLITLLYIAEHDYGYFPMTDVSNIDKGQYAPLFEAMMEMMEMQATEEPEMQPTEEAVMEPTEEAMMEGTMLAHGDIEGENQVCTDLRHELDSWFLEHFMHEMEGM